MAQPTKQSPTYHQGAVSFVKNANGTPPIIRYYLEGTSETFKKGDLVIYDDSEDGVVALANASGVPSSQAFLGVALDDASNVTSGFKTIPVLIPTTADIFSAAVASDQDTAATPTIDDRGGLFGLIKTSTTYDSNQPTVLDSGNTNWVKVIDVDPRDVTRLGLSLPDLGTLDSSTRLLFHFLGAVVDSDGTQS